MICRQHWGMKTFIILASILTLAASAQDLQTLLSEAQRDFIRGDKAGAKEKFTLVQKADPKNRLANTYLSLIAAEEKKNGGDESAGLRKAMEAIIIDKVEFRDATVSEALEFLGKKISASGGKVNIVQQAGEAEKAVKITISLSNISASEALRYVAGLANLEVGYEKFAVVVRSKAGAQPAQAPKPAGGIKIDGL